MGQAQHVSKTKQKQIAASEEVAGVSSQMQNPAP
jgi:hypothetical protein